MSKGKIIGWSIFAFVALIALTFLTGGIDLAYKKVFKPAHENVDREVFENTQSYVHGKVQDLAKYKREYDATNDPIERKAIQNIINQQFAQFDKKKIVDDDLRDFLVIMRGF
jgi:hypothetical protein